MLCAISGEAPQEPVVSNKSGNVFEKRLIVAYISENGKDPVTGEDLTVEDLIDVKTSRVVRPRPPTLTSIPSLLSSFQNEWDALALESYTIRQQLQQTRQELATALYQHDAAVRVIARITRERDEARDALSKVTVSASSANNGDHMQVDSQGLPEHLIEKIDTAQAKLSKSRKKRPVPQGWATAEDIQTYTPILASEPLYPGSQSIALDATGHLATVGGADGIASVYSIDENKLVSKLEVGGEITDSIWVGNLNVISSSTGIVKAFEKGEEVATWNSHAGSANALAMHPCGDLFASVGVDKSFVFYDIHTRKAVAQTFTDSEIHCAAFHPDGHLFAVGTTHGQIEFYHTKTSELAATYDYGHPVQAITFSENGYWFAAVGKRTTSITIFDLRQEGEAAKVKIIDTGSSITDIDWDYTGQFLATAGPSGITVQQYTKASKSWSEPLRSAVPAAAIEWRKEATSLVTVNVDGVVSVLGAK